MNIVNDRNELMIALDRNTAHQTQHFVPGLVHGFSSVTPSRLARTSRSTLRALTLFLRNATESQYSTLVDIAVTDKLLAQGRFTITYLFLSSLTNQRVGVVLAANEVTTIPSLAAPFLASQKVFPAAS